MGGSVELVQSDPKKPDFPTIFKVEIRVSCLFEQLKSNTQSYSSIPQNSRSDS